MSKLVIQLTFFVIVSLLPFSFCYASEFSLPNTFTAGTKAVAEQVNENFRAVKNSVDDNNTRLIALETALIELQGIVTGQIETINTLKSSGADKEITINSLKNRVSELENSQVMALSQYISMEEDFRGPIVKLTGVNLQILNGQGSTETTNGLGNIIIGYDETFKTSIASYNFCSNTDYVDQSDCEYNGYNWGASHKIGSHFLVLGTGNSYLTYGGIVAGQYNKAVGMFTNITGGVNNTASGEFSSVSGGVGNTASGSTSSISGGGGNKATGYRSSVNGGGRNIASNNYSSVCGGDRNIASGWYSTVMGGQNNTAKGNNSSVSGGKERSADTENDWVAGSLNEDD